MLDLETFGLDDDGLIFQIGAVAFDDDYNIVSEFNQSLSIVDGLLNGFTITPSTLDFWKRELKGNTWTQDQIFELFHSDVKCKEAAENFHGWIEEVTEGKQFQLWANGILFDVPKADNLLKRFGFKSLTDRTRYSNIEDLRTLRKTTRRINPKGLEKVESVLRAKYKENVHNAVFDCHYQIELFQACMSILQTSNHFNTKGEEDATT
jgi:hypothetical protein